MAYLCTVCGGKLERVDATAVCTFCGRESAARYRCAAGHTICEDCQLAEWPQVVERVCEGSLGQCVQGVLAGK